MDSQLNLYLNKVKENFVCLTDAKIYVGSTLISAYLSYRYLKGKELYSEHHGHFNSARNMFNRSMMSFYLKEAVVRFAFGIFFFSGGVILLRNYMKKRGEYMEGENLNKNSADSNIQKKKFNYGDEYLNSKKLIDLNDTANTVKVIGVKSEADLERENSEIMRRKKIVDDFLKK